MQPHPAVPRGYQAVREDADAWQELASGVRARLLERGMEAHAALVEFAPAARLPASERRLVRECLVLEGDLDVDGRCLGPLDYHLTGLEAPRAAAASEGGALLFLRTSMPGSAFGGVQRSLTVSAAWPRWEPLREGVRIKPLCWHGARVSMLARLAPGARLPGMAPGHPQECLVVEGALDLGGQVLHPGGFQRTPADAGRGERLSPAGCLLFLHDTVDALSAVR